MSVPTYLENFDSERGLNLSGLLVTALVGGVAALTVFDTPRFPYVAALAITQLALFAFCLRLQRQRYRHGIFWLQALCIGALLFLVASNFIAILTVVWVVQSVELYGPRRTVVLLVGSLLLFTIAQLMHLGMGAIVEIVISTALYGMLQLFAVSVVQRFVHEREQKESMAALNRELIATRQLLSQSAAQSERLRISRDLHDILGHHMTALILNLEVASHHVKDVPKLKVEQSLALAKLLLGDLRSTVSELRDDSVIDLEESIKQLVSGVPKLDIEVDFSAAPRIEDIDQAETLLRCCQEAVTNVLRHSNARHCRIALSGDDKHCTLSVRDNGRTDKAIEPGNGLKGMAERVSARGGELTWKRLDTGFELQVTLSMKSSL